MNFGKQFKEGLITNNPVLVQVLGMCSVLAITTSFFNGLGMGAAVTGVSVVKHAETAGIGTKVVDNEPNNKGVPVLDQFVGKSAADAPLNVGSNVDAITGATVSTKGITAGVNAALSVAGVLG